MQTYIILVEWRSGNKKRQIRVLHKDGAAWVFSSEAEAFQVRDTKNQTSDRGTFYSVIPYTPRNNAQERA